MSYYRRNTSTVVDDDLEPPPTGPHTSYNKYFSQGEQQQQKYRDHNEGFFSKLPFLRSIPIPTNPFPRLLLSLFLDIVGIYTQVIPFFGFAMWPTISSYLVYRLYGSTFGVMLSFVEETIPGLGFIPTATLCWINEKYDLFLMAQKYLPFINSINTLRSWYHTVFRVVKYIFIITLSFIVYQFVHYMTGGYNFVKRHV